LQCEAWIGALSGALSRALSLPSPLLAPLPAAVRLASAVARLSLGSVTEHLRSSTFFNSTADAPPRFFLVRTRRTLLSAGSPAALRWLSGSSGWATDWWGCRSAAAFVRFLKIVTRWLSK